MNSVITYVISGFRREVDEKCTPLGYYAKAFMTPEDGSDRLFRNVGKKLNYHYSLRKNPEERSSRLYRSADKSLARFDCKNN